MGRRVWSIWITVLLAAFGVGCGGSGGGPSDSGTQFVFEARGRLSLSAIVDITDPTVLTLTATLLDPQGFPFRNERLTFAADFNDVTIIPQDRDPNTCNVTTCSNRGAVLTDNNGQAHILLIAGLTTGWLRVIAEAPPALNISTGITVTISEQGFISLGTLSIVPSAVTFINPIVGPDDHHGPMAIFQAVGGTPPYVWENGNVDLGSIEATGIPDVNETAEYTLTGPIPTEDEPTALQDTITLYDSDANQATATISVVFADCTLMADQTMVTLIGVADNNFQIDVSDGVPPFAVTQLFPDTETASIVTASAVDVLTEVIDEDGIVIPGELCDATGERCVITFTIPTSFRPVAPGTILIRDARGCKASIELTIELCGNGVRDISVGEECDGSDFPAGLSTCADFEGLGALGGIPLCTDTCTIDSSNCMAADPVTPAAPFCGNGIMEAGEGCDFNDFGGATCTSLGLGTMGSLVCDNSDDETDPCVIDVSASTCL